MLDADENVTVDALCSANETSGPSLFHSCSYGNDTAGEQSAVEVVIMVGKLFLLSAIILTTIVGNLLVLFAVFVNSHLRSTTNYFIVNLAVADLLLGTTVLPFSASLEVQRRWDFGPIFCDIWAAVDVLCCTASIISLCAISVDRYIGVTRPLAYSTIMTEKRAIILIVIVWILSTVISVGPLLGWKENTNRNPTICTVTQQLGYVLFSVSGSFYIPTTVILLVYYRIYRAAIKQTKFLERGVKTTKAEHNSCQEVTLRVHTGGGGGTRSQSADNLYTSGASPEKNKQLTGIQGKLAKFKRQKKAAKTLGIVVGVFILCWFPFFFILPLSALCSSCYIPDDLFQVIFWLGYCNSCLNPIIYASSSREFKRAFAHILRCEIRRKPRLLTKESTLGKTCIITMRSKASHHEHRVFQAAPLPPPPSPPPFSKAQPQLVMRSDQAFRTLSAFPAPLGGCSCSAANGGQTENGNAHYLADKVA